MIRGLTLLHISLRTGLAVVLAASLSGCVNGKFHPVPYSEAKAQTQTQTQETKPGLVVTNEPPPSVVYRRGSHDTVLAAPETSAASDIPSLKKQSMETPVTVKVAELNSEFDKSRGNTDAYKRRLQSIQDSSDAQAALYYTLVASINADLQTGTTPGNPILIDRWNAAQEKLNALSQGTSLLNALAMDLSYQASNLAFLMDSTHAAFALSGAVDEDHKKLTILEDNVNQDLVETNRLMTKLNDDVSRRTNYLRTERANLQTLSLAIANGELYGKSITNGIFKRAAEGESLNTTTVPSDANAQAMAPATHRPLVIIRFDHPNVNYDQPLYAAINQALEKYPSAKFDLVAVSQGEGNPAQLALSSEAARKNGEAVLRSLTQMGLPMERITLSAANSKDVLNSEVHIYIQ
jgi:hypothetical protein